MTSDPDAEEYVPFFFDILAAQFGMDKSEYAILSLRFLWSMNICWAVLIDQPRTVLFLIHYVLSFAIFFNNIGSSLSTSSVLFGRNNELMEQNR